MRPLFATSLPLAHLLILSSCLVVAQDADSAKDAQRIEFFESKIRPALVEHCQDCHATDSEASGGLLLDSRDGWMNGGDSGRAIIPGDPAKSRVFAAISYTDPKLQMPPDEKLPDSVIDLFRKWIADGAVDPRKGNGTIEEGPTGLPVERAQEHWAYRPLKRVKGAQHSVDYFVDLKLQEAHLEALPASSPSVLVRRLYFDLTGLPPPPAVVDRFQNPNIGTATDGQLEALVDELLASPAYGEHFARKWMDVARYAESITLRGFVLPQAWRYRDYLIQAYHQDRPFDVMIREQLAGDLLDSDNVRERSNQLIATAFLAMGNTNLERQDKTQLEMDFIDEQLEVIGRAFLGQTIGCARCHDHKFDPIPTRDYYALAGVFRSAVALKHDNVSKWIEMPLPLEADEGREYESAERELKSLQKEIKKLQAEITKIAEDDPRLIPVRELPGVVIDDVDAKFVGTWKPSTFIGRSVGAGYVHDDIQGNPGKMTATFEPKALPPGKYEVRIAYSAFPNRASNTKVHVFSADGEAIQRVNQRQKPKIDGLWASLGSYTFEKDGQCYVLVSNEDANGVVIVDAVQFLPHGTEVTASAENKTNSAQLASLKKQLEPLESRKKELDQQLSNRPHFLTVQEQSSPRDIPIHIRGDVHNLAEVVPRGFLTAFGPPAKIDSHSSGRLEFANWICAPQNPLTARVYANRVWTWLMGTGLVPTPNNFGTTGAAPTHPELLDWLAGELIDSGWSTKHLVRLIVQSEAYRRALGADTDQRATTDPDNFLYWRGHDRRLSAEALRDAMLSVSGELDRSMGGSMIPSSTKADYNYDHKSTRRSIYHPVFRNSLPELFEAFDFADTSVSIGQRPRSTVATQALVLMNHPWVRARAKATAETYASRFGLRESELASATLHEALDDLYRTTLSRPPSARELELSEEFITEVGSDVDQRVLRLEQFVQSLFASIDFRYLE